MDKIISSITGFFLLIAAVFGISYKADTNLFVNNDWMKALPDDAYLNEVTIPGTHDSAALYELVYSTAKCQQYTLADQLDMGVRYLDIRGMLVGNKMQIVHGALMQGLDFEDVTEICYNFLKENPTETIIMSMKLDTGKDNARFEEIIKNEAEKNADFWYTQNKIPTIGEARGKIILFNRFLTEMSNFGLSTWNHINSPNFQETGFGDYGVKMQDNYRVSIAEEKWSYVEEHLNSCYANTVDKYLYMNFTSGYKAEEGKLFTDLRAVSDFVNPKLLEYISNAPNGCYGIVIMDFATQDLCTALIEKNQNN